MENNSFDLKSVIPFAVEAAVKAGQVIMEIYESDDFDVLAKSDNSPLTKADRAAHNTIVAALSPFNIPILSEEGKSMSYDDRKNWDLFWLVDPLDGTKEFIKKNGEFTVNIALIKNQKPVWGVVYAPAIDKLFYVDADDQVAFVQKNALRLLPKNETILDFKKADIRVVASRSHMDEKTTALVATMNNPQLVSMGSSLKFMVIAEGIADVYPRFAPTMEWDTAAAHAILSKLNFKVLQEDSSMELQYNKENLLNPGFIVY